MQYLHSHKSELTIIAVWLLLLLTNVTPNTYLTGWDSLQTELDPLLGIKRAFFSVWEEYQSFGLVAGMGHAADLVHALIIFLLSFVLPQWSIRYAFHMLMIPSAGLGALTLLRLCGFDKEKKGFALLGALFYIFNFAVIQMLYLPFESFSIFFGALPWMVWVFLKVIDGRQNLWKQPRLLLLFIGINFLGTSSFQAQQLFVVYILLLGTIAIGYALMQRSKRVLLHTLLAMVLIGIVNSFWLLPQAYFLLDNGSVVKEAKMNQLVTQDVFYSNKDKGSLTDFLSFTGFFYDRLGSSQQPLFLPWKQHRESIVSIFAIATLAGVMLLGLLQKSRFRLGFILAFFMIMVGLLLSTPPFEQINVFLRGQSFINQIFRSPFTKFSIPYALVGSYFFTAGLVFLATHLTPYIAQKRKHVVAKSISVLTALCILFLAFPAFTGNYIARDMRASIPQPYKQALAFFKTQDPSRRITLLPDYTFWGWFYTNWGYNGSGFLWYGIEQPIVSRTFDVWSKTSESYYWEMKDALEAEQVAKFEAVLAKYNIDYILFDTSLLPVVSSTKAIQYDRLKVMLAKSSRIKKEKQWDFLSVYRVASPTPVKKFVGVYSHVPNIGPAIALTNTDTAYATYGTYQTAEKKPYQVYFPFLDMTTQTHVPQQAWSLAQTPTMFTLFRTLAFDTNHLTPSTTSGNLQIQLYRNDQPVSYELPYMVQTDIDIIAVSFPKIRIDTFVPSKAKVTPCLTQQGTITSHTNKAGLEVASGGGASACFSFTDLFLDQRYGYVVQLASTNKKGQRLFFYILDETKQQPYSEDRITQDTEYYIIGSKYNQGFGYSFSFQNTSYPTIPSQNTLNHLAVYLLPYDILKTLELENTARTLPMARPIRGVRVTHPTYDTYTVSVPPAASAATLVLYQSFDPGWMAYQVDSRDEFTVQGIVTNTFPFLFGKKLTDHVVINNWANGWNLPTDQSLTRNSQFVILFWPQYLQYVGFALLLTSIVFALIRMRFSKPD